MLDTIDLAKELIRRPSVTPDDAGCQNLLADLLTPFGFQTQHLPFGEVKNIWLRRGQGSPHFVFVGHTDVVPVGDEARWQYPPFTPTIHEGKLYGRGSADMKGNIAAFVTAAARFSTNFPRHAGTLSMLFTSDEEGPSIDGIQKVVAFLKQQAVHIDYCLVGEPTCEHHLGDTVKIGRRGSLTATVILKGIQGHIAYPHLAKNPIHQAIPFLHQLMTHTWDQGNAHFQPTSCQIASIAAGANANNIIPGTLKVIFNFRFNPLQTVEKLQQQVSKLLQHQDCEHEIEWAWSGLPYYTPRGQLSTALSAAIEQNLNIQPKLTTDGGTSDGRFIAPLGAQVAEFGLVNRTIHQVNENVDLKDLEMLSTTYEDLLQRLLG